MKKYLFLLSILFSFFACNKGKKQIDIITVDVNKQYPEKEAIPIQNIADVKYIPLETNNAFLCGENGGVMYMDNDFILFNNGSNGDVLVFNGSGTSINKFNRKGQGPEEYIELINTVFDKEKKEIYVHDYSDRILIYDLSGQFKRKLSLLFENKGNKRYNEIFNYDKEHLLYYIEIQEDMPLACFMLISKQTGNVIKENAIRFNELQHIHWENNGIEDFFSSLKVAFKQEDYFCLNMLTNDTLYKLTSDFAIEPIIARSPSFQKMASTWGIIDAETPNYRFMTLAKDGKSNFSTTSLFFDKRTGEISKQNFYNADDLSRNKITFGENAKGIRTIDNNQYCLSIPAYLLTEMYENGKLTGKLKEIASNIGEDDNPLLMVVKFK
jgi:hypothetical protein